MENSKKRDSRREFLGKLGAGTMVFGAGSQVFTPDSNLPLPDRQNQRSVWDPYDFGAAGDGKTKDTKAIQAAIDACFEKGGGKVVLHGGTFVSGTILLKSRVNLHVESGAVLLGSEDLEDYPDITPELLYLYTDRFTRYLIYAEKAENISITGRGTIDGRGRAFPYVRNEDKNRPYIIRFAECTNVAVRDITFLDSARWLQHYLACENVLIDGITVIARTRENRDGIDIDSCHNVRIANSYIDSGDDAIVLKALAMRPCRNVTVSNCVLRSSASALKLGTESNGGFENILFTGCAIYDTTGDAIALEMVDGGKFDRVTVSDIVIHNARCAIFIRLGNRARIIPGLEKPGKGTMSNIIVDNIQATGIRNWGCSVTGLPDQLIENVRLSNLRIRYEGGGTLEDAARIISEKPESYPSSSIFGILPAYGFFCRHIRNLELRGISVDCESREMRPAFWMEDIRGMTLSSLDAVIDRATEACIVCADVKDGMISGCRSWGNGKAFLKVAGEASENIYVTGNDLSKVVVPVSVPGPLKNRIHFGENFIKAGS